MKTAIQNVIHAIHHFFKGCDRTQAGYRCDGKRCQTKQYELPTFGKTPRAIMLRKSDESIN